jgi:hypothetical protein
MSSSADTRCIVEHRRAVQAYAKADAQALLEGVVWKSHAVKAREVCATIDVIVIVRANDCGRTVCDGYRGIVSLTYLEGVPRRLRYDREYRVGDAIVGGVLNRSYSLLHDAFDSSVGNDNLDVVVPAKVRLQHLENAADYSPVAVLGIDAYDALLDGIHCSV